MKKAIIFDLYGTLIDIETDEKSDQFWLEVEDFMKANGIVLDNVKIQYKRLVQTYLNEEKHTHPDIDLLDVFRDLIIMGGKEAFDELVYQTAKGFRSLSTLYIRLYPYAIELLTYLKQRGFTIILLSNAQACFTTDELKSTGLYDYFDAIFLSSDYKMCKPNPAYFQIMLEEKNLRASECIYVGNDHLADVAGAHAVNMDCIYLHTNCSQKHLDPFDCLLKINPGDLKQLMMYFEKRTF